MVNEPPKKCGICGEVIPFIPTPLASWEPPVFGPARGHYDYASHKCSDEAMAAWKERTSKAYPKLTPAAKELAEKIASGE